MCSHCSDEEKRVSRLAVAPLTQDILLLFSSSLTWYVKSQYAETTLGITI